MSDLDPDLMPLLTRRTVSDALADPYAFAPELIRVVAELLRFLRSHGYEHPRRTAMHTAYRAKTRRRRSR